MTRLTLILLLTGILAGKDLRIHVLTPFRLTTLVVQAPQIQLGPHRFSAAEPVTLHADDSQISCRIGSKEMRGARLTSTGPTIVLRLPDGSPRRYRGALEVNVSQGALQPVVTFQLEDAVASAVAAEMPNSSSEARKAQAVATRSYYTASRQRHRGFDFCDTTHCQFLKDTPEDMSAATGTRSLVLIYRSRAVGALYFRSCGGRTFPATAVGLDGSAYPYFSADCETCRRDPDRWKVQLPLPDAETLLDRAPDENRRLLLARKFGWNSLRSNDYDAVRMGEYVEVSGQGHGHGVGLCQRGAIGMAAAGHDFATILRRYYSQTSIAVR